MSKQSFGEIREELARQKRKRAQLADERNDLEVRCTGMPSAGEEERLGNLARGIEALDQRIAELDGQYRDHVSEFAENPGNVERMEQARPARLADTLDASNQAPHLVRARDQALRTLERWSASGHLSGEATDRMNDLVLRNDPHAQGARYVTAVGDPAYFSAFGKILADPTSGHLRFNPHEVEAVRKVTAIESERAALAIGSGGTGGFAVPLTLDPTVNLISDGELNPVRQVARVVQTTTNIWQGVNSEGVVASYDAEAEEVSDDSPSFTQPEITCARGTAFVPFSIEIGQDWGALSQELVQLFADARDVLDSQMFLTGSGTDEPTGILTSATGTVLTATASALAIGDIYTLRQSLPTRFAARATWAGSPKAFDQVYRFVGGGSSEPPVLPTRNGAVLGDRKIEWSTFSTATTTPGATVLAYGDFNQFVIADRIGMNVEIVQHMFGSALRPTGQRGLFAYWRTGSKKLTENAFRFSVIKA
jgi:HK97 family phage major capsid protein